MKKLTKVGLGAGLLAVGSAVALVVKEKMKKEDVKEVKVEDNKNDEEEP